MVIYNDQGYTLCEAKIKPNDIFENGNIIVSVGKNIIEVFEFTQNNDNNNNKNKLEKKKEINIDNNKINNNDNFINNNNIYNSDNEITCITLAQGFIVCGHASGLMSIWKPTPEEYLKKLQSENYMMELLIKFFVLNYLIIKII